MVDGVVNLVSSQIQTHMAQAVLSGVITLDREPLGAGYTFSSVSIAATGVTGAENNFLHVGVSTTNIASDAYGQGLRKGRVNVTHFR